MAEEKLGKSLDALIEENRKKVGSGSSRAGGRGGGRGGEGRSRGGRGAGGGSGRPLGVRSSGVTKRRGGGGAEAMMVDDDTEYGAERVVGFRRGGRGGRGAGGGSRGDGDFVPRASRGRPTPKGNPDGFWEHDLYEEDHGPVRRGPIGGRAAPSAAAAGAGGSELLVENLDYSITERDLRELFSTCGNLIKVKILYDRSGRSEGRAQVSYTDPSSAAMAVREYNGVKLDGNVLKITYYTPAAALARNGTVVLSSGKIVSRGGGGADAGPPGRRAFAASVTAATARMGGSPGRGGSRGGRGGRLRSGVVRTREQLDQELDLMRD